MVKIGCSSCSSIRRMRMRIRMWRMRRKLTLLLRRMRRMRRRLTLLQVNIRSHRDQTTGKLLLLLMLLMMLQYGAGLQVGR